MDTVWNICNWIVILFELIIGISIFVILLIGSCEGKTKFKWIQKYYDILINIKD